MSLRWNHHHAMPQNTITYGICKRMLRHMSSVNVLRMKRSVHES